MKVRIIGIDFGTSNSALGFRDFEKHGETLKPIGDWVIISENDSGILPTIIVEKNAYVEDDLFAFSAERRATDDDQVDVKMNFKMELFEEVSDEQHKAAVHLTEKYFKYLYKMYKSKDNLAEAASCEYEIQTILTCPVRTNPLQKDVLVNTAKKAGFINVQVEDEVITVMRYAMGRKDAAMLKLLEKEYEETDLKILIIDMGAGTTDMILYSYRANPSFGNNDLTELASWPRVGEQKTLGGREFDKLLLEFCIQKGFVNEEFLLTESQKRYALLLSKMSKENTIAPKLKRGDTVEVLGQLAILAEEAPKAYRRSEEKINRGLVENISSMFLNELIKAIKDIFSDGGIAEGDLDFLILSGGGSKWYFIKDILLGNDLSGAPITVKLNLSKLQKEPQRMITDDEPQLTNLKGILSPMQNVKLKPISRVKYDLELNVYSEIPDTEFGKERITGKTETLIHRKEALPKNGHFILDQKISILNTRRLRYTLEIFSHENDEVKKVYSVNDYCPRNLGTTFSAIWHGAKIITPQIKMDISYKFSQNHDLNINITFKSDALWNNDRETTIR